MSDSDSDLSFEDHPRAKEPRESSFKDNLYVNTDINEEKSIKINNFPNRKKEIINEKNVEIQISQPNNQQLYENAIDVTGTDNLAFTRSTNDIITNTNRQIPNLTQSIPKKVTLSWKSVSVTASTATLLTSVKSKFKKDSQPQIKTILKNVDGIVQPGQMVALMGARY
jgi:hypothetical protein